MEHRRKFPLLVASGVLAIGYRLQPRLACLAVVGCVQGPCRAGPLLQLAVVIENSTSDYYPQCSPEKTTHVPHKAKWHDCRATRKSSQETSPGELKERRNNMSLFVCEHRSLSNDRRCFMP